MRDYVLFDAFDSLDGWTTDAPLPKLPGVVAAQADLAALEQNQDELLAQQSEIAMQQSMIEAADLAAIANELTVQLAAAAAMEAATAAESGASSSYFNPHFYSFDSPGGGFTHHTDYGGSSFDCYVSPDGDVYMQSYDVYSGIHTSTYSY